VEPVPLLEIDGGPVSSTRIREALQAGRVAEAARLLGRSYDLTGRVVPGEVIGRTLGFPTANLRLHEEKFLPADGVYAARASIEDGGAARPAALSIGVRPTFGGQSRVIEVFLLDWSGDLAGREVTVDCVDWIRSQEAFESPEALTVAMHRDVEAIRTRLAAPGGPASPASSRTAES
jgi:riboflavin kinase/FMN adenylyltransferase